jgi:RNA recognition motif-containing protein
LFGEYGSVDSAAIINDRETGRSRGFGFVEMENEAGARAIEELDGKDYNGRNLKVNEARPREERGPRR